MIRSAVINCSYEGSKGTAGSLTGYNLGARKLANYLIDQGGDNVETVFYKPLQQYKDFDIKPLMAFPLDRIEKIYSECTLRNSKNNGFFDFSSLLIDSTSAERRS